MEMRSACRLLIYETHFHMKGFVRRLVLKPSNLENSLLRLEFARYYTSAKPRCQICYLAMFECRWESTNAADTGM